MSTASSPNAPGRSSSTRKSLSAVTLSQKHHATHRKRAKSMASTNPDELTPRSRRRRSLVPKKSILKQSNGAAVLPLTSSQNPSSSDPQAPQFHLEEFTLNFTRASSLNPDRRVSFAPNAHVRVIPKESHQTPNSSSPASSPQESSLDSPGAGQENTRPSQEPSPLKKYSSSRRSSLRHSYGGDGEGEASMDLASDTSYLDDGSEPAHDSPRRRRSSSAPSEGSDMDLEDSQGEADMDLTTNTNLSGRLSIAKARRSSTRFRRESAAAITRDENEKPTEYTVTLEESLKGERPPSAALLALRAIMTVVEDDESPASPPAVDIDVASAAERLLKAGQDLRRQENPEDEEDDGEDMTISSGGDSMGDGVDKTMDFTAMTGGIRRTSMRDVTGVFPRDSFKATAPEEMPEEPSTPAPLERPSAIPVPVAATPTASFFKPKSLLSIFTPRLATPSPVKAPTSAAKPPVSPSKAPITPNKAPHVPKATPSAAFVTPSSVKPKGSTFKLTVPSSLVKSPARQTPSKRPLHVDEDTSTQSPAKKLIVAVNGGSGAKAIAKVSPVKAPEAKEKPTTPRKSVVSRPSDSLPPSSATPVRAASVVASSPMKEASTTNVPETPRAIVPPAPKSPLIKRTPLRTLTPVVEAEVEASPPIQDATPTRALVSRRSFQTPSQQSPWRTRGGRPSAVPSLGANIIEETDDTKAWADGNPLDFLSEEARAALPTTVDEFLRMANVAFMDNVIARRRSTMALRSHDQCLDGPISTADYAIAMAIDFPQLNFYNSVVTHITGLMDVIDQGQRDTDNAMALSPPLLVLDYAEGSPEQRAELKDTLETIKVLTRSKCKLEWYHWRRNNVIDLQRDINKREQNALQDLGLTRASEAELAPYLPGVEAEHAKITAELEMERAAVVEIEKCDPKELAEVKSSIADNASQIKMIEDELAEMQRELDAITKQTENMKSESKTLSHTIEATIKTCDALIHNNGPAIAQDEIRVIQRLSSWKALTVLPDLVRLEYAQRISVTLPCNNWVPNLQKCSIRPIETPCKRLRRDILPAFTAYTTEAAHQMLVKGRFGKKSVRKIMDRLSAFWTACDAVRHEIVMLRSRYCVDFRRSPENGHLLVETSILFAKTRSKVVAELEFSPKDLQTWPLSAPSLRSRVSIAYKLDETAELDTAALSTAMQERLSQTSMSENFGALLDACADVADIYS